MNLKCPAQLNQTIIIKTIEMKIQHLRGGQIANLSVRISDSVNKFQHHGKLFSEINVKSSNREHILHQGHFCKIGNASNLTG